MDKIILKPEQQTNTLRKYKGGYHEQLKDSDSEAYNALLRARNHLNYIKHSESIKQSQKKYYNKEENRKKIIETATTWISEHPVQHSFNQAHSRFLTFVKGSSVAKLIKNDPSIVSIYHQDLLIIKQVMADYIETVEYPSDVEWHPLVKVVKVPKNIDKDVREEYNKHRANATRWAAPMTERQFFSKSAYFRANLHAEYLKRLYNDFAILNSRIEELGIKQ